MKKITKITWILSLAVIGFSCSNKELESRLAKLEGKMAQLETKNGVKTTPALSLIHISEPTRRS